MRPAKFDTLAIELERLISSGEIGLQGRLPSQSDIVERFGASRSCVNKALNVLYDKGLIEKVPGKGNFVSSASKKFPRPLKNLLYLNSSSMWLHRTRYDNFGVDTVFGIEDECKRKNISFILRSVSPEEHASLPAIVRNIEPDGVIVMYSIPQESIALIAATGMPVVCVDIPSYLQGVGCTMINYYDSYMVLASRLAAAGVSRISFLYPGGAKYGLEIRNALSSIRSSHSRLAISDIDFSPPGTVYDADRNMEMIRTAIAKIISGGPLPEIVICNSDYTAEKLLAVCKEHGINVPSDMQVIGGLGLDFADNTVPVLSTLAVPAEQLGRQAVNILWDMVTEGRPGRIERILMEYRRGGSCVVI